MSTNKYNIENFVSVNGKLQWVPDIFIKMQQLWGLLEEQQEKMDSLIQENVALRDSGASIKSKAQGKFIFSDFALTKDEYEKVRIWQINHENEKHPTNYSGAIGGKWDYHFTPTAIGTAGSCVCNCCGEEFIFRILE